MRRIPYHAAYLGGSVEAVYGYLGAHDAVQPVAATENNADNGDLGF